MELEGRTLVLKGRQQGLGRVRGWNFRVGESPLSTTPLHPYLRVGRWIDYSRVGEYALVLQPYPHHSRVGVCDS